MRRSSGESHSGLLDSIVCSAERLCEGEDCCLRRRRKVIALCFLYKIYHRADHPISEYLKYFLQLLMLGLRLF